MKKWIIILLAIVAAIIIGFAVSVYIVFAPFLDTISEVDELNSIDMEAIQSEVSEHAAAMAFMDRYPESYVETENLGIGGTIIRMISEDGSQLTIDQDTDGIVTNVVYICFYPDGLSTDSFDGPNVAEQIPIACKT